MDNTLVEKLSESLELLLDSEDNTGCSEDLTVVSKESVEQLRPLAEEVKKLIKSLYQKKIDVQESYNWAKQWRDNLLDKMCRFGGG